MDTNTNETKLLDIQIIASLLYIGSLLLSIILTYNDKQITLKKKTILTNVEAANLSVFNRIFIVILTIVFLYTTYQSRENAKKENQKIWPFDLQMYASELSLIATVIVLYVVIKTAGERYSIVPGINNPSL